VKAAEVLRFNPPKVSALSKDRLEGLSVERLMRFLTSLNQDVEIVTPNRPASPPPRTRHRDSRLTVTET
jgi:predicted XRE-type DNA-binding protein